MTGGKFHGVGLNGAISSPPYVSGGHHPDQTGSWGGLAQHLTKDQASYGLEQGQIGRMSEGEFESVVGAVTSPPYEDQPIEKNSKSIDLEKQYQTYRAQGGGASFESFVRTQQLHSQGYGETAGQIGAESGETYWQAMAQVYAGLHQVLKPGGVAAIVVKDFVRNKQIVPLCDRTAQLLEAVGFTVIERTRAMLVKEVHTGIDLFSGEHRTKRVERKSFFRRLAEKNGSPAIDLAFIYLPHTLIMYNLSKRLKNLIYY